MGKPVKQKDIFGEIYRRYNGLELGNYRNDVWNRIINEYGMDTFIGCKKKDFKIMNGHHLETKTRGGVIYIRYCVLWNGIRIKSLYL